MKKDIKLIALDLDGTLLSSQKELTERNRRALERAAERGIHIVPSTGRLARAVPEFIAELPFVRYMICVNGSHVYDKADDALIYRAELPYLKMHELMVRFDDFPCIYDCYIGGRGWMQADMYDRAEEFAENDYILELIRNTRTPVPNLKEFVLEQKQDAQKVQMFFRTIAERDAYKTMLRAELPELVVTSSYGANIEINCAEATKGEALRAL
ncbi:MAG: HAD-IIB family hydrolase, partial [Oscillospiraceae bacterium]|nr:HAD-IIB family hydrolase [Oscillospiraceae bacterium]